MITPDLAFTLIMFVTGFYISRIVFSEILPKLIAPFYDFTSGSGRVSSTLNLLSSMFALNEKKLETLIYAVISVLMIIFVAF